MSFVLSVISANSFIIAGDTQLNTENGKIIQTGIKVFPIDPSFVIGMTGDYKGNISAVEKMIHARTEAMSFNKKVEKISQLLAQANIDSNVIAVGLEGGKALFATMGRQTAWQYQIQSVANTDDFAVRFLLPPDVNESIIYPYLSNIIDMKSSVINCIRTVSKHSASVNDKIFGMQSIASGLFLFTDNIEYDRITFRLDALSPGKR